MNRVLLSDDHTILLECLRTLLEPRYDLVGTAGDGLELVHAAMRLRPDLVVADISMPVLNGLEAARQIRDALPLARIIILSQHSNRCYIQQAFRNGASAYVLKQGASGELLMAMSEASQGRHYISRQVKLGPKQALFNPKTNPSELFATALSARQREVLRLIADGNHTKEIAFLLKISPKTVEYHRAAIMDELGLRTTAELTRYAVEHGISPLSFPCPGESETAD